MKSNGHRMCRGTCEGFQTWDQWLRMIQSLFKCKNSGVRRNGWGWQTSRRWHMTCRKEFEKCEEWILHIQLPYLLQERWWHLQSLGNHQWSCSIWTTTTKTYLQEYSGRRRMEIRLHEDLEEKNGDPSTSTWRRSVSKKVVLEENKTWWRQGFSERNLLDFGLHMFEWFFICTHRDTHPCPPPP